MKILFVLSLIFTALAARAEDFGVGVILGDPTGLSAKMKLDGDHSLDGALAYSTGKHSGLQLHADYLRDHARSWTTKGGPLDLYYGLGGRVISYKEDHKSETSLGPRGSLGLSFDVFNPNIELFGELALILEVVPDMTADLDAGIGARIRF